MDKHEKLQFFGFIFAVVVWALIACDSFSQGRTTWAVIQVVISVGSAINAVVVYLKARKNKQ